MTELRGGTRYHPLVPFPARFHFQDVAVRDLAEGGMQIQHASALRLGTLGKLQLFPPLNASPSECSAEHLEFHASVVWSRIQPGVSGRTIYRSGIRIEKADADQRSALRKLIPDFAVPDSISFEKKRRKYLSTPSELNGNTLSPSVVSLVQRRRHFLRSNPAEAMTLYRRARRDLTYDEVRTIEDPRESYRRATMWIPLMLAVWESLGRTISLAEIAQAFETPHDPRTPDLTGPELNFPKPRERDTSSVIRADSFEICR